MLSTLLLTSGAIAQQSNPPATGDTPPSTADTGLVTVNGQVITRELYATFLQEQIQQDPKLAENREQQMALLNRLVNFALMSQDAISNGLDRQSAIAAQLEIARNRILTNAAIQDYLSRNKIPEEELRESYRARYQQKPQTEFRLQHIQLSTEAGAIAVIEELKQGASFAALAAEQSSDSSGGDSGDLGWMSPALMDPAMRQAVENLQDGEYARRPVRSEFGWHVVRRAESREIPQASYGEVRDSLLRERQRELLQQYIAELREQADVKINTR